MDARRHAPAVQKNREPILAVLRRVLPATGLVLEVASGSGEHAVFFAAALPHVQWQPTDPDPANRASIAAWRDEAGLANLRAPLALDATDGEWPIARAYAIVCINLIHIAPWAACLGLLDGAARVLGPGGRLYLYGPYLRDGRHTAPSNAAFDASLRARDPAWGVRDAGEVAAAASARGLSLVETVAMPNNNLSLLFGKDS